MVSDEELKKIQWNAQRNINDEGQGMAITMAMDPTVVFAMVTELLKLRVLQREFRQVEGPGPEQKTEAGDGRTIILSSKDIPRLKQFREALFSDPEEAGGNDAHR